MLLTGPDKLDSMNLLNFMSVFAILILAPCICVTEGGGTLCSIAIDSVKQVLPDDTLCGAEVCKAVEPL